MSFEAAEPVSVPWSFYEDELAFLLLTEDYYGALN